MREIRTSQQETIPELKREKIAEIITQTQFHQTEEPPRKAYWYDGTLRSYGSAGTWEGRPTYLKIVADRREEGMIQAHETFNALPDEERGSLKAPKIFASGEFDTHGAWVIMEELPNGEIMKSPLRVEQRREFLSHPFADTLRIKEKLAYREPIEEEQLSVADFCASRFNRWKQAAQARIEKEEVDAVGTGRDLSLLEARVLEYIREAYGDDAQLEWTYGLPKPDKYIPYEGKWYLTDFKLVAKRPAGYDLAVAIWADVIMPTLEQTQEKDIQHEEVMTMIADRVEEWKNDWESIAQEQGLPQYEQYKKLLTPMLAERVIGSIYGDSIAQENVAWPEAQRRVEILKTYCEQLLQ